MKDKVICIVGPTASGKTSLGVKLAKAVGGEIISADSMQIYKGLDIATAKVTKEETEGIPHHMIDICNIDESFSVADFKALCYDKIEEILSRNKVPIIVGGTGLYVTSVVKDMQFDEQEIDYKYREKLENIAKTKGNDVLYKMLEEVDPSSAKTIHANNVKRVIRALEIAKNSEKSKSKHMEEEENRIKNLETKYDFYVFCIDFPREILYDRINYRVDLMVKQGVLEEAKEVFNLNLPNNLTCMQAIGYKEFFPYFKGEDSLENCIEKLKKETRNYAKRQVTWFKNKLNCIYLDGSKDKEVLVEKIKEDVGI